MAKNTTMRQAMGFIRLVAAEYNVPVVNVRWKSPTGAQVNAVGRTKLIKINTLNRTPEEVVQSFFHELGHIHCMKNGIYPAFHGLRGWDAFMKASVLHGLQAERYVDDLGRELMKQWVPVGLLGRRQKPYATKGDIWHFKFNLVLPRYMALVRKGVFGRKAA